jgi:hypothetical protein
MEMGHALSRRGWLGGDEQMNLRARDSLAKQRGKPRRMAPTELRGCTVPVLGRTARVPEP